MRDLTWDAADLDNAASESNVIHPTTTVQLDMGSDSFEDYSTGSPPPAPWEAPGATSVSVETSSTPWGSQTAYLNVSGENSDVALRSTAFPDAPYETFEFAYNEPSSSQTGVFCEVLDSNGDRLFKMGTDNPEVTVWHDGGSTVMQSSPSQNYDEWRLFTITADWSTRQITVLWEDITGSSADEQQTFDIVSGTTDLVGEIRYMSSPGGQGNLDCNIDRCSGVFPSSGSLITQGKVL